MRITEFATELFTKVAPVNSEVRANLSTQLSHQYTKILENVENKNQKNEDLTVKAEQLKSKINSLPEGSDDREKAIFEFTELQDQFEEPSIIERVITFLDKPMVRLTLLIIFGFVAKWLTKKLTMQPKDEREEEPEVAQYEERKNQPHYGYQQQPYYPPYYGYGFQPPHQQQYEQGKR